MKKTFLGGMVLLLLLSVFAGPAFAVDPEIAAGNADAFGAVTLLPPLVAIALAFITKNVVLSLFLGAMTGAYLLNLETGFLGAVFFGFLRFIQEALGSLADPWDAGIILQVLAIGGLIALITKMGGAKAVAESLATKAKSPVSAQIITWVLGIFIFFDDYANSLITGPIMRPVTDKMKISREKLAFIVDATAAPIAGIALISTWVAFEVGLIADAYSTIGIDANAYGVFVSTIPYRFYNILILAFIVFSALTLKDFGPMLKAEQRARSTGKVIADGSVPMVSDKHNTLEPAPGTKLSIWNAIVPIGVLIIASFAGFYYDGCNYIMGSGDTELISLLESAPYSFTAIRECFGSSDASVVLFQAALFAGIVAMAMAVGQKIMTLSEAIDTWVEGLKSLLITGVILILAWSLSGLIKELGTAYYLINVLSDTLPIFLLPSVIFILGAIISFATGTSYGTMGILMPLAIPLAYAMNPVESYVIMSAGAVLTGAIFGDHCSPISDTTILSSMGAACDHIDHTKTQIVYALTVAALTIVFGYLPVGMGMPVGIVLPVSILATGAVVVFFGKKPE